MKKLKLTYKDGSSLTVDMKNNVNHMDYIPRNISYQLVESITLQQYPKSKNELVKIK